MPLNAWEAEMEQLRGARWGLHAPVIATPLITSERFDSYQTRVVIRPKAPFGAPVQARTPAADESARWEDVLNKAAVVHSALPAVKAGAAFHRSVMRSFERLTEAVDHVDDMTNAPGRGF